MKSSSRIVSCFAFTLAAVTGCTPDERSTSTPDVAPSTIPTRIDGDYALVTTFDLATLPEPAVRLLASLDDATDTPEDPARYIVDRMIATLPDGSAKSLAISLAGYIAPYVQLQIDRIAPRFAPGIRTLVRGVTDLGRQFATTEQLHIAVDGAATRTLVGLSLASTPALFTPASRIGATATMQMDVDLDGTIVLAPHALRLPYGEVLGLALDRAVIPSLDASASNLAELLSNLVACDQLGIIVADRVGIGSAQLYATACSGAMLALSSEIYERIYAIDDAPFMLDVSGSALGVDLDVDGMMDELCSGAWRGTASYAETSGPIGRTTFAGTSD
jgi:hypothetical protein